LGADCVTVGCARDGGLTAPARAAGSRGAGEPAAHDVYRVGGRAAVARIDPRRDDSPRRNGSGPRILPPLGRQAHHLWAAEIQANLPLPTKNTGEGIGSLLGRVTNRLDQVASHGPGEAIEPVQLLQGCLTRAPPRLPIQLRSVC